MTHLKKISILLVLFHFFTSNAQQKILLEGLVKDANNYGIPYASLLIETTNIGTATNEDGEFNFSIPAENSTGTLVISSIGFATYKISIKDFLALKKKEIILKEDVVALDEIKILSSIDYVEQAFKNLKKNSVSTTHQLTVLNRQFYIEDDVTKFFIEHYLNLNDSGPYKNYDPEIEILQGRKSADYRKIKENIHTRTYPIYFMNTMDPLRRDIYLNNYIWTKIGDTSYDGEGVVIIKGEDKKNRGNNYTNPVYYIGIDTYRVYKTANTAGNLMFLYQKNNEGKMYLKYHYNYKRQYKKLSPKEMALYNITDNRGIKLSKRNEIIVINAEFDKKKIKINSTDLTRTLMENIDVKYSSGFWNNFVLPPPTEFYKTCVKQLEANFGVPIETQFNLSNK